MRYIYVTLRKRNNIKQRLFLETQKLKVATSTWSMLEPRMLNVNHLQYTMEYTIPHLWLHRYPPEKESLTVVRLLWVRKRCALLQSLCLILQQLGLCGNGHVDILFDRCMSLSSAFLMHCQELQTKIIILPLDSWDLICWRMHIHSYHTLWIRST